MNSYFLYGPNNALLTFTVAPELQFHIFNPRGKIIQNVNFTSISQTSNLISKLNPTRQHESKGMLGFQKRALDTKLLKFHVNQDNWAYFEKRDF